MLEVALWSAIRALEEKMMLARRIAERARNANNTRAIRAFEERAQEAERHSSALRQLLLRNEKGDIAKPVIQEADELTVS